MNLPFVKAYIRNIYNNKINNVSISDIFPSIVSRNGEVATPNVNNKGLPFNSSFRTIVFPIIARIGIVKRNSRPIPPNIFPIKIEGLSSIIEFMPIDSSGTEVIKPKIKKEAINGCIFRIPVIFWVFEIITPDINHIKTKDAIYKKNVIIFYL